MTSALTGMEIRHRTERTQTRGEEVLSRQVIQESYLRIDLAVTPQLGPAETATAFALGHLQVTIVADNVTGQAIPSDLTERQLKDWIVDVLKLSL